MRQNIYDNETFFAGYQDIRAKRTTQQSGGATCVPGLIAAADGKTILDLGCGFGDLAAYCVAQGAEWVVATDISARMLAQAQEVNSSDKITYQQSAMEDLDFAPGSFDLVVSSLPCITAPITQRLSPNVAGWLKPGGVFVYSVRTPYRYGAAGRPGLDQG